MAYLRDSNFSYFDKSHFGNLRTVPFSLGLSPQALPIALNNKSMLKIFQHKTDKTPSPSITP
jgi:hypothetical protein